MLALVGASACSAEPASGDSSSLGGAPGGVASGGAGNNAEAGRAASVEASTLAPGGGASAVVPHGAESGASASVQGGAGAAGAAGAGLTGSADGCDLDAFARDFTRALAQSTAPSGCAIPIEGVLIGKGQPVSSAALDFIASTYAESPGAFTFMLESCDTPRTATCANYFDKFAGQSAGGDLWILAHPLSETIERCSTGVELSVWTMMVQDRTRSGTAYCLMGDRGGQAMGYCVFDADVCAAKSH